MPIPYIQQAILKEIEQLPDDADITTGMFRHLAKKHLSVVNKAIRALELQGHLEFSHSVPTAGGGIGTKVWRKRASGAFESFQTGLITEGVFADLFAQPKPIVGAVKYCLLSGR